MEDVIVQRTTIRSTTENPSPKKGGSVYIQGDNINIGTMIVNSPNAVVDNSTRVVQVQQNYTPQSHNPQGYNPQEYILRSNNQEGFDGPRDPFPKQERPKDYHNDRDFFKNMSGAWVRIIPSLIMMKK